MWTSFLFWDYSFFIYTLDFWSEELNISKAHELARLLHKFAICLSSRKVKLRKEAEQDIWSLFSIRLLITSARFVFKQRPLSLVPVAPTLTLLLFVQIFWFTYNIFHLQYFSFFYVPRNFHLHVSARGAVFDIFLINYSLNSNRKFLRIVCEIGFLKKMHKKI